MNFSNENVLIIAILISIIIMFLTSGCLCKNNTEQFIDTPIILDTDKVNSTNLYKIAKEKSSDAAIVSNAIKTIVNAMNKAKSSTKNNVDFINAFIESNAITNSTNNITSNSAVSKIKSLTEPIIQAIDASKIAPNIKMTPKGIESAAKINVDAITNAINNASTNANNGKNIANTLEITAKNNFDKVQAIFDNYVKNNK